MPWAGEPWLDYGHPYRWRTRLRVLLPRPVCWWVDKGKDCESVGAEHHWYNQDDDNSACYHCKVVRAGRLWGR
jgi:hypothetical protein